MTADANRQPAVTEWLAGCQDVLYDVLRRRHQQVAQYGLNEELLDGTGPDVQWLYAVTQACWFRDEVSLPAVDIEEELRAEYVKYERDHGSPTWMHLVREEVAEAFKESDPAKLEDELLDVAALCVSWVEKLRLRSSNT